MAQGALTIQTTGVLSGLALVNAINDALDNLASNASGSTDPSGLTGGVLFVLVRYKRITKYF